MALSLRERERRYKLIRARMQEHDLDVLVVIGRDGSNNRGNHRYLAGYGVVAAFDHYVVFPREEIEPVFFSGESLAVLTANARGWVNDTRPQLKPRQMVVDEVRRFKKGGRIGLVELDTIPTSIYLGLAKEHGSDAVCDARDIFKAVRLPKSEEEIGCCRKSAAVADGIYRHLLEVIRPGLSDYEIYGEMSRMIHAGKCEYSMNIINCDETSSLYAPIGNRLTGKGRLSVEITPAYEGYFTQLRADIPVSPYAGPAQKLFEAWERADAAAVEQLKPGSRACDVYSAAERVVRGMGYAMSGRAGHALGLDADEFLSLDPRDDTVIQAGMVIVVHIQLRDDADRRVMNGRTFLVTGNGPEPLNQVSFN